MIKNILATLIIGATISGCAVAAVGAGAGAVAATATDARGGKTVFSDQDLEHSVNNALDAQAPKGSYTVASYDGYVLLAGQVPTAEYKDKAYSAAKNTEGVKGVYNYLSVEPNEEFSSISNDAYLTSLAKSRLIAQKDVNTNNIKVVTCNKVVYLLGSKAGNKTQVNGGVDGIKSISGVKNVVNLIKNYN